MTSSPSKTIGPGWLPMRDDLGTDAPIRADVQRELATVRAEQNHRAKPAAGA
jgi:hypothetical protein